MGDLSYSQQKLARITSLTAIVIAATISIGIPFGYYWVASQYEDQRLLAQADHAAESISKIIFVHPDTWELQEPRLVDFLEAAHQRDRLVNLTIVTNDGLELVTISESQAEPVKTRRSELSDGSRTVGWIEAQLSLRPLLITSFLVFLGSLMLGIIVNVVLRVLPFAALQRTMNSLNQSRSALQQEVENKDRAFAELKKLSETVRYQALHDELTSLPNRTYFLQELSNTVNAARTSSENVGVLLVDLDRFKEINDTLGHHMGDEVLVQISQRLLESLPEDGFLARLGGDEYVVVLDHSSSQRACELAEAITEVLKPHVMVNEYHLNISGSIGVSQFPDHGDSPSQLLRHADIAMYQAKRSGQDFCWYQTEHDDTAPGRLALAAELRQAIDQKLLTLHYQPKIELQTNKVIGVEALARWEHPQYGYISPVTFITIAEQAGMINALTDLVLELAMEQLSTWKKSGLNLQVAINISAKNLQNATFPEQLQKLAEYWKIDPDWLLFEITESSIMFDPEQAKRVIHDISLWGAKIAVDDFGTGYSSLSYVKRLAIKELKIDRSFVLNMVNDSDDQAIVKSTIDLAHSLNLLATAEGIEDSQSLDMLQNFACDYAQGYHICRPIDAAEFTRWWSNWSDSNSESRLLSN